MRCYSLGRRRPAPRSAARASVSPFVNTDRRGRGLPALLPPQVLSSPEVPATAIRVPPLGSPLGKARGGGVSPGRPDAGLTSAGSVPRGPEPLRAAATNGPAPRARRPRRRLEVPGGRGGAPDGTPLPTARRFARPLSHSPLAAGRRPFPCLDSPRPSPAPTHNTHRPNIYLRRAAPAQPSLLPGPAPTCPASEPLAGWGRAGAEGQPPL